MRQKTPHEENVAAENLRGGVTERERDGAHLETRSLDGDFRISRAHRNKFRAVNPESLEREAYTLEKWNPESPHAARRFSLFFEETTPVLRFSGLFVFTLLCASIYARVSHTASHIEFNMYLRTRGRARNMNVRVLNLNVCFCEG